jgi:hypothetical protein
VEVGGSSGFDSLPVYQGPEIHGKWCNEEYTLFESIHKYPLTPYKNLSLAPSLKLNKNVLQIHVP